MGSNIPLKQETASFSIKTAIFSKFSAPLNLEMCSFDLQKLEFLQLGSLLKPGSPNFISDVVQDDKGINILASNLRVKPEVRRQKRRKFRENEVFS